jgi:hydrogenase expression/formation protein HypC
MCLGIPAQLVAGETGHPDLVVAEVGGVPRTVNVGLLDERPAPGDWILVHMGFALNVMTPEEAADALAALGAERQAERDAAGPDAAGPDAAGPDAAGPDAAGREAEALNAAMDAGAPAEAIARWMS